MSRHYSGIADHLCNSSYIYVKEGHCSKDIPGCSTSAGPSGQKRTYNKVKNHSQSDSSNQVVSIAESSNSKRRRWMHDYYLEVMNEKDREPTGKEEMYKDMLKFSKEKRILMHKVNILCLVAYGNRINSIINDEFLMAAMLSLVPPPLIPVGPIDIDYFLDLVEWYRCVFVLANIKLEGILDYKNFESVFQTKQVICLRDYVMLFVSLLRALGFRARFVMSLQPYPINVDDFEKETHFPYEDDFENPGDYIITLKKGRGYIRSKKGKDLLTQEALERLNKPLPVSKIEREKLVLKKYKTVLAAAIKRKRVKLDHWVEVFVKKERRWMSVNIIHQTVDDIDSIYDNLTLPLKYCLAWTNCNNVLELTKFYAPDWYRGTSKRRADKLWVDSTFSIFDKRPKRGRQLKM